MIDLGPLPGPDANVAEPAQSAAIAETDTAGAAYQALLVASGVTVNVGPLAGYSDSFASAIDDSSAVVGYSQKTVTVGNGGSATVDEAFLYDPSQGAPLKDLGTLGGTSSQANAINDAGQVVGSSTTSAKTTHAFLDSGGQLTDLGTLGSGIVSAATAINGSGTIAGDSTTKNNGGGSVPTHAFLLPPRGAMQDLGTIGGADSWATGIDDAGDVVGYGTVSAGSATVHAFLYTTAGGMQDLGTIGGYAESHATAIDDAGDVVGYVGTLTAGGTPNAHAFLYRDGSMVDLNSLLPGGSGWDLLTATAINGQGVIAGIGILNGSQHGYLLNTSGGGGTGTGSAATATALRASAQTAVFGQPLTLSAFVSAVSDASAEPAGSVTFSDGSTVLGTAPLEGGVATLSVASLPVGADGVVASYAGDPQFGASASPGLTITIAKDATSVVLTSIANLSSLGERITFTAVVSALAPGGGTPTGTVTFKDGAATLGRAAVVGGVASEDLSGLSTGKHTITASYSGDSAFLASSSPALSEGTPGVDDSTRTTLNASAQVSYFGRRVTITVTVRPSARVSNVPTGRVTFMDGAVSLGPAVVRNGKARITVADLPTGTDRITAIYAGDQSFTGSVSAALVETIGPAPTKIRVTAFRKPPGFGQTIKLKATVRPTGNSIAVPTGSVSFLDGTTILGTAPLSRGTASIKPKHLSRGEYRIRVVYNAAAGFAPSATTLRYTVRGAKPSDTKAL